MRLIRHELLQLRNACFFVGLLTFDDRNNVRCIADTLGAIKYGNVAWEAIKALALFPPVRLRWRFWHAPFHAAEHHLFNVPSHRNQKTSKWTDDQSLFRRTGLQLRFDIIAGFVEQIVAFFCDTR